MEWRRPDNVPFPTVWRTFEGRQHGDSPPLRYIIQEITEDLIEGAIDHMCTYFLVKENVTSTAGYIEDKKSVDEISELWRDLLKKQRVGLVALVEDPDKEGVRRIAGVNMVNIADTTEKDHDFNFQGEKMIRAFQTLHDLEKDVDIPKLYGTTVYMSALGLSVAPQYQGDNVGYELLMARTPLCKAIGMTLTVTAFTGSTSQHLARKAGFETLAEIKYPEYKQGGKVAYPRLKESCLLMAKPITPSSK